MDVYEAKQPLYDEESQKYFFPMISINSIYPIGSIYLSVNATNPANLFGGEWEQIAQGRTLFGADGSDYIAGNTVEAGLPNVSGSIGRIYNDYNLNNTSYQPFVTRPFYYIQSEEYGTSSNLASGSNDAIRQTYMDLSKANSIYGNSTTVQPPAFVVYMWKRIK